MNNATDKVTEEDLRRIGGRFREKYGLEMDTLTAALLQEVQEIGQRESGKYAGNLDKMSMEMEKLRKAINPLSTNNPWVSFTYGLGQYSWALAAVLVAGFGVWLHHFRLTTTAAYQQAMTIVERYPNLVVLEPLVKSAKLVERQEGTFLEIAPARDKMIVGKSFVVDPAQKMDGNARKILIPLRFN